MNQRECGPRHIKIGEYRHGPISAAGPGTLVWGLAPLPDDLVQAIALTGASIEHGGAEPLAELVRINDSPLPWPQRSIVTPIILCTDAIGSAYVTHRLDSWDAHSRPNRHRIWT